MIAKQKIRAKCVTSRGRDVFLYVYSVEANNLEPWKDCSYGA